MFNSNVIDHLSQLKQNQRNLVGHSICDDPCASIFVAPSPQVLMSSNANTDANLKTLLLVAEQQLANQKAQQQLQNYLLQLHQLEQAKTQISVNNRLAFLRQLETIHLKHKLADSLKHHANYNHGSFVSNLNSSVFNRNKKVERQREICQSHVGKTFLPPTYLNLVQHYQHVDSNDLSVVKSVADTKANHQFEIGQQIRPSLSKFCRKEKNSSFTRNLESSLVVPQSNTSTSHTNKSQNTTQEFKTSPSMKIQKPKRPLSAYNLFFRHERANILGIPLQREHHGAIRKKRRHVKVSISLYECNIYNRIA